MGTRPRPGRPLDAEVAGLRVRESRRAFDATVYVGSPGGRRDSFVVRARDLPSIDRAIRTDVVSALLDGTGREQRTFWLTRPGKPEVRYGDLDWITAASTAFAMHGRPLYAGYVVTRSGWCELPLGHERGRGASD